MSACEASVEPVCWKILGADVGDNSSALAKGGVSPRRVVSDGFTKSLFVNVGENVDRERVRSLASGDGQVSVGPGFGASDERHQGFGSGAGCRRKEHCAYGLRKWKCDGDKCAYWL